MSKIDLAQIKQNGAANGQIITWNQSAGKYVPSNPPIAGNELLVANWQVVATGTGSSQVITIPEALPNSDVEVYINGIRQAVDLYTIAGTSLTLTAGTGAYVLVERRGGRNGTNGTNGTNGIDGIDGINGTNGIDGDDGAGVQAGGTTGQVLVKTSNADYATTWADSIATVVFVLNGGGLVIPVNDQLDVTVDFNGQILGANILADVACTATLSLYKSSYAAYPPVIGGKIFEANVGGAIKSQVVTPPGSEPPFASGDILRVNLDSNDVAKRITITLKVRKTS